MSRSTVRRMITASGLAAALVAVGGGVASAHVTVSAPEATSGGSDALVSFRVPDESDTARTVAVTVQFPADTPIASVLVQPKPGWTSTVTQRQLGSPIKTDDGEITDVVAQISWRTAGTTQGIGPGQFEQFVVIAGQLPKVKTLTFKAVQSYSDGKTVSWIEVPAPGSTAEPEHPAPVLTLAAGSSDGSGSAAPSGSAASPSVSVLAASDDGASKGAATTGIVLGALGVLLGLAALGVAIRRRPA
jgi:uncharacterized protein